MIIVGAVIAFMGLEFAGAMYGWSNQVMGIFELGIAAVFIWVMIEAYGLWRSRQPN